VVDDSKGFLFVAEIDLLKDITRVDAMYAVEIFEATRIDDAV
jgi:hypothetical protein